jgi:hypothetical protein
VRRDPSFSRFWSNSKHRYRYRCCSPCTRCILRSVCHVSVPFCRSYRTGRFIPGAPSLPPGLNLVRESHHSVCAPLGFERIYWTSVTGAATVSSPGSTRGPCLNECIDVDHPSSCLVPFARGNLTLTTASTVGCYCSQQLAAAINSQGIVSGSVSVSKNEGTLCSQIAQDFVIYNAFTIIGSIIVVIVNTLLRLILDWVGTFEGHKSVSKREQAIAFKTAVSLFLNTACIILLINAALPDTFSSVKVDGSAVFIGTYRGFDFSWHTTVGAGLVLTMVSWERIARSHDPCLIRVLAAVIAADQHICSQRLDVLVPPLHFSVSKTQARPWCCDAGATQQRVHPRSI